MEDCLHTSSDNLAKLVKWAHSHGTICTLIPSLKHLLTEGAHGNLTALWGCSAGHAYHWPLTATCKTSQKERVCYPDSRSINAENLMQGSTGGSGSQRERFLERASKVKGDCVQAGDSCDFSNCSEPSEADDNTEEYNANLFDIVCESSATDEDGDSEPHHQQQHAHAALRKRALPGVGGEPGADERSGDPVLKKIKQETSEDYYTVANAQLAGAAVSEGGPSSTVVSQSPRPSSQTRPSSLSSLSHKPSSMDGDSAGVSPLPTGSSSSPHPQSMLRPMRAPIHCAQSKAPGQSSSAPASGALHLPGKSEMLDRMPGDELAKSSVPYGDLGTGLNPDLDLMAVQALNADSRAEASGKVLHLLSSLFFLFSSFFLCFCFVCKCVIIDKALNNNLLFFQILCISSVVIRYLLRL